MSGAIGPLLCRLRSSPGRVSSQLTRQDLEPAGLQLRPHLSDTQSRAVNTFLLQRAGRDASHGPAKVTLELGFSRAGSLRGEKCALGAGGAALRGPCPGQLYVPRPLPCAPCSCDTGVQTGLAPPSRL